MANDSIVPSRPRVVDDGDTTAQAQTLEIPGHSLRSTTSAPERARSHDESDEALAQAAVAGGMASLKHSNSAPTESLSTHALSVSPQAERLPSFRQLSKIAAHGEHDPRPAQTSTYPPPPPLNHHSPNPAQPSATAAPPTQSYAHPPHMPPAPTSYVYHHQSSPTTIQNEPSPYYTASSTANMYSSTNYYPPPSDRRSSVVYPRPPATLISSLTSSSESSNRSLQSTGTEDWSTAHTTPIESADSAPRKSPNDLPQMPPPPINTNILGTFVCDYAGCTAPPFQTQYLLNSHANVHSSNRPHYCPVAGCPRSEGGKGFKRKNEMIRHGLVHDSPGYMCPFCPDRDHRYPRPDNLQRHVRVHHIDKDKDDPLLRDVLNQRAEGLVRGRRRRTGP